MPDLTLGHFSVRTSDLERSLKFYTEVLGLRPEFRPPFKFPGHWLYASEDESGYGVVHLVGEGAASQEYLGPCRPAAQGGTGELDHIAFSATGWAELRSRCADSGISYIERSVPSLDLHQVFLVDPSGITIELNYPGAESPGR